MATRVHLLALLLLPLLACSEESSPGEPSAGTAGAPAAGAAGKAGSAAGGQGGSAGKSGGAGQGAAGQSGSAGQSGGAGQGGTAGQGGSAGKGGNTGTAGKAGASGAAGATGGAGGSAGGAGAAGDSGAAGEGGTSGAAGAGLSGNSGQGGDSGAGAGGESGQGAGGESGAGAGGESGQGGGGEGGTGAAAGSMGSGGEAQGGAAGSQAGGAGGGSSIPADTGCKVISLDGKVESLLSAPHLEAYNPKGSFTVEAWVYLTAYAGPGFNGQVVAAHWGNATNGSYSLQVSPAGLLRFYVSGDGITYDKAESTVVVPLNQWVHTAGTFDASTGEAAVMVNGKDRATLTMTFKTVHAPSGVPLTIGNYAPVTGFFKPVTGYLDEVRLSSGVRYSSAFTPALYLEPDTDTFALFHLDDTNGTSATDTSSNQNTGTLGGGAAFATAPTCR